MLRLALILCCLALPVCAGNLEEFPVWQAMDGMWRGELDYYDGEGDYRTRDYNAIFEITIEGGDFHQQNWMFYGPQHANTAWITRGLARPGEGAELIVNTYGRAIDDAGTMQVYEIDHMFDFEGGERSRVVSDSLVIYDYIDPQTGILQHLQMVNMGVEGMRIRSSQGFDPNRTVTDPDTGEETPNPRFGQPRAASFYRETRMDRADFDAVRAEFRDRHNVAIVVEAGATPDDPSRIWRLDAEITECDWLANHPFDPFRVTGGVAQEDVDTDAAIPACEAATAARPNEPRLAYQAGRAQFYAGNIDAALPHLRRAAIGMDYPQAQFVLGFVHDTKASGLAEDRCLTARLWRRAALQGLFYAEYSYAKGALAGRFDQCGLHAAPDEIAGLLESALGKSAFTGLGSEIESLLAQATGAAE